MVSPCGVQRALHVAVLELGEPVQRALPRGRPHVPFRQPLSFRALNAVILRVWFRVKRAELTTFGRLFPGVAMRRQVE